MKKRISQRPYWDITLRFSREQERVLRVLAAQDERSINAIVRRMVDEVSRRDDVRKLLDGEIAESR